jgi:hypothetical protein
LLASFTVACRIDEGKKLHSVEGSFVFPATVDAGEIMFGESYAKELRKTQLADNTVGRKV